MDHPAPGLWVAQPKRAFRYGSEAFWLAGFALETAVDARDGLDFGTGSGIVALLLARVGLTMVGVDHRPEWLPLWTETLRRSEVGGRVTLVQQDVRSARGPVDLVVSNPPFFADGTGPSAADPWRAAARTESTATLSDFVAAALAALRPKGLACVVVPLRREAEVDAAARRHGAIPTRIVRVGRRRSLLAIARGEGPGPTIEHTDEAGALVSRWRAAVAGPGPSTYRDG